MSQHSRRQWIGVSLLLYLFAKNSEIMSRFFSGPWFPININKVVIEGAFFVIILRSAWQSAFISRLKTDRELWKELQSMGIERRFIDLESPDAESYRAKADEIGLPAYFLINGDSRLISSGKLPSSPDQILKIARQEA